MAATVAAIGGLTASIGIIAKSDLLGRPIRWLWKQNVTQPVGDWGEGVVRRVVDERIEHLMHNPNNGSSLLDLARSVNSNGMAMVELAESVEGVKSQVSVLLDHNAARDVAGKRYQSPTLAAEVALVQEDVATLLDHDEERDVTGKRFGVKVQVAPQVLVVSDLDD